MDSSESKAIRFVTLEVTLIFFTGNDTSINGDLNMGVGGASGLRKVAAASGSGVMVLFNYCKVQVNIKDGTTTSSNQADSDFTLAVDKV